MRQFIKIIVLLGICGGVVGWYAYSRGITPGARSEGGAAGAPAGAPPGTGAGGSGKGPVAPAVPVGLAHVKQYPIEIYLDGLGNVQALQTVTIHSQVDGVVNKIDFVEGEDVTVGKTLVEIDPRTYKAQLTQAQAKKQQDEAKADQDRAKVVQDRAKKQTDEALEKQAQAKKAQDEALEKQAVAKKSQDKSNYENATRNLKRFEDSFKTSAVSEQVVMDQRSLAAQLDALVQADDAAIVAVQASIRGDEVAIEAVHASVQGDEAAINADLAAVKADEAVILADDGAIKYVETFLSYCTIKSPINGRTGVRLVDAGNLIRANDVGGIVVLTQLQPISIVFTLPQQNLQAINAARARAKMTVIAVESDGKTELDRGELLLVDNQIDPTTGTIKLKATFPNEKFKLWPGGFVDVRLLLETRQNALVVSAPAVQQGPNGTFVFQIKTDPDGKTQSVEMRPVKVGLIQDGKAILDDKDGGLVKDDEVVLSGHDRLKNGTKVTVDRSKVKPPAPDGAVKPGENAEKSGDPKPSKDAAKEEAGASK